ncbi:hypothetical protein ACTI_34780 [Actinoplanes sp. OR16]|uniref:type VII secretion protein EccE n=1 Tax=Actinoplanes sp. OR16 TaxID=946334 RepID=UPI000F6DE941|nr:type VII secretion protein EccE [Actinoplanes sp. OR16]BBH66793.1 hypothetical protein ACTI_34780 [Actinoplanes sp. OR16]
MTSRGTGAPAADAVKPIPQRGRVGPLSLTQVLVAEGSLLAIIAAATHGLVVMLITTVAAALLLAVVFARSHHRWWLEYRALTRDHQRRRSARRETEAGPVLAALRTIAPGLTIRDISTSADEGTGVARDEAGWFGVVTLDRQAPIPLDTLVGAMSATEQPGLILELVTHTIPAPTPDLPPASPAVTSYRQLGDPGPAHRETSLSVRLDARALAESVLDHTTDPAEAARLTAALTRKIATTLRRQGITSRVLDAAGLLDILARSCDARVPEVAEEWTHWRSNHLIHRTYWLETWPDSTTEMGPLLAWASTAPASQTSVAIVLDASRADDIAVRAFIRLATRPDADLDSLGQVMREGVRRAGGELRSLDGEQGIAAYATAPTGGGAG